VQCLQNACELFSATKLSKYYPETISIHSVECFSEIHKDGVQVHVLFLAFFLKLAGSKDHVSCASIRPEATLRLEEESDQQHYATNAKTEFL